MGIFSFLDRTAGDSRLSKDWQRLSDLGTNSLLPQGQQTTEEGLAGLRNLDTTYQNRLSDPLGDVGRGIFTRARGALTDTATRATGAYGARLSQLALQSGGTLSPEAQAELRAQNNRDVTESLFTSQNDLTNKEASLTLDETSKLFDRMESIRNTILNAGQTEQTRGLQAIMAGLAGRTDRMKAIWSDVTSAANAAHHA